MPLSSISQRALLEGRRPVSHWPQAAQQLVDQLIAERAPYITETAAGRIFLITVLRPLLSYKDAVFSVDAIASMSGHDILRFGNRVLGIRHEIDGLSNIPKAGGCVIVANHPTGLADGLVIHHAVTQIRPDLHIMANADALRIAPGLRDVIIPVEWVPEKRTTAKTRETLKRCYQALQSGRVVMAFPSGRIAYVTPSGLKERPWMPAALTIAQRAGVPIVPARITARNSTMFYVISQVHKELRDITLFRELLNKRGKPASIDFGPPITLADDQRPSGDVTQAIQHYVETAGWR